jgi:hypothetical protein
MRGAIPLLSQYAFMAWCSVKNKAQGLHLLNVNLSHERHDPQSGFSNIRKKEVNNPPTRNGVETQPHREARHWLTSGAITSRRAQSSQAAPVQHLASLGTAAAPWTVSILHGARCKEISSPNIRWYIQNFPDWPPGARTANGTALYHKVQLYRYFVSQSSEFCRHKPLCCFSTSVYCYCCLFRYRLSTETFGYTLVEQASWGGGGEGEVK